MFSLRKRILPLSFFRYIHLTGCKFDSSLWSCAHCGSPNPPGLRFCRKCVTARSATAFAHSSIKTPANDQQERLEHPQAATATTTVTTRAAVSSLHQPEPTLDTSHLFKMTWCCRSCGTLNDPSTEKEKAICTQCSIVFIPGENWGCGNCGAVNHISRNNCFECGRTIEPWWSCLSCRARTSVFDYVCRVCHAERPRPHRPTQSLQSRNRQNDWSCAVCHKTNYGKRDVCFQCETSRSESERIHEAQGTSGGGATGSNNWICSRCQTPNFRTRDVCWKCSTQRQSHRMIKEKSDATTGAAKPLIGVENEGFQQPDTPEDTLPAKPKVWVAREDQCANDGEWVCAKCIHRNYRNDPACFRCGTKRTVSPLTRVVLQKRTRTFKL